MSFFTKMFGTKPAAEKAPAAPVEIDFLTALTSHIRGDLGRADTAYQNIIEKSPDDTLASFFAAAIKAAKGNSAEAAESLRSLSARVAEGGDTISHAIVVELLAQISSEVVQTSVPAVAALMSEFGDRLKTGRFLKETAVCYEMAAGLLPDNPHALHKLGDTLHDLRMYDYAEQVLLEALKCAPNHWDAIYTYAVLLQDLGRDEEAITYYEKAAKFNPDHVNCQNNYGAALIRTNRAEEALIHCRLAERLDPTSPSVKINLGNAYLLQQEYEKARVCFSEAVALNDRFAPAYFGLGSAEESLGSDPKRVLELYLKALELNPSIADVQYRVGTLLAAQGNPEALSHFSMAAKLNGNMKNLHKHYADACLKLGRPEEALEHLKTALQQNPDDVAVREMIARIEAVPA